MELFELETQENEPKLKLSTKAWKVNLSKIKEGYCYCMFENTQHGETKGKAKTKLWNNGGRDMELCSGKEMTFTNFPIIRAPESDLYIFEGKEMSENKIHELLQERKRLEDIERIINDESVTYCYIVKRGSYYGYNYGGYVYDKEKAGVYPKLDAKLHALGCREITLRAVDIDYHNSCLEKKIQYLESCKIKK